MASSASPPASSGSNPGAASTGAGKNREVNSGEVPWFIATRATNHMTGDKSLISNLVPVNNQVVEAGEGEGMKVCGKGSVNTEKVVLPDVWYVAGLTANVVSVGQLTEDHNLIVQFGGGMCRISKESDGSVLGRAPLRPDRKYAVDFLKIELN
ncbi:unnamed protein product [Miscanthus lutarioriparius]|uniref:Retrovirus-related Pol polyprotein from transposon TNT 1-94-like beta-barrel domain-containing protein n=1 Tax=Miscanthus lutarioriparius TaxID=422564 RepID=A0A811PXR2_9POAL|nr:unnamed protein product [Miscanthus lutarioriparius]